MAFSRVAAQSFAEAHQDLAVSRQSATGERKELHIDLPVRNPSHRRWFIACVVMTGGFVAAGWMYFFSGQVSALAQAVPGSLHSEFVQNIVSSTKAVGAQAATGFQATAGKDVVKVLGAVKQQADDITTINSVVDQMKTKISTADPVDQTQQ